MVQISGGCAHCLFLWTVIVLKGTSKSQEAYRIYLQTLLYPTFENGVPLSDITYGHDEELACSRLPQKVLPNPAAEGLDALVLGYRTVKVQLPQ